MLDTDVLSRLVPLSEDSVRWHLSDDTEDGSAIDATCRVLADRVSTAWDIIKERAAANRQDDPAMHRMMLNLHLEGLDATPDGAVLDLYVSSRGIHDLLHARTGARLAAALSAKARIALKIAGCDSRLRWTRGIRCHHAVPVPAPAETDWNAIRVRQDAIINGHVDTSDDPNAGSTRLLLALERRAGIPYTTATWAGHPDGMVTLWFTPQNARRLIALGIPAAPRLGENGSHVGFTLTNQECSAFTATVLAST
ncbi:hypothetical protein [Streptomyces sp. NPDC002746]